MLSREDISLPGAEGLTGSGPISMVIRDASRIMPGLATICLSRQARSPFQMTEEGPIHGSSDL
jgi:hypothetical protein